MNLSLLTKPFQNRWNSLYLGIWKNSTARLSHRCYCGCFNVQKRNASSEAQRKVKDDDTKEEIVVISSIASHGFSLYHRKSRDVINFGKDFLQTTEKDLNDIIDYPKWLTPEKLHQIQSILDKDKHDESPARNIESVEDYQWNKQQVDTSKLLKHYLMLSKMRLTGLVVLTSMAGFAMAPGLFNPMTFLVTSAGTALTSASANATNQFLEVPYDSQMNRTKNRVLVRGFLTPTHALYFAAVSGSLGFIMLYLGANPLTAWLGAFNWVIYTMFYTPMKRWSILNTWVGSIVGAIPPMMGWAAVTGGLEPGAWLLAAIMFAWQFPHFNALSWNLRPDYSRGGYRMMSVIDPELCKRVAMRYAIGMIGLCYLAPILNITTWTFAVDSTPLNFYFAYLGWKFYRDGDSNSSRKLFRFSLIHLPLLFVLMISAKNYSEPVEQQKEEAEMMKESFKKAIKSMVNIWDL